MLIKLTPNLIQIFAFRPQYVYQISARLKPAYVSYINFCKVYKKKREKTKIF